MFNKCFGVDYASIPINYHSYNDLEIGSGEFQKYHSRSPTAECNLVKVFCGGEKRSSWPPLQIAKRSRQVQLDPWLMLSLSQRRKNTPKLL